ncbi:MAG: P1 family peptidase [Candidatus Zhuqueibacterota bacterium]
MTLSICSVPGIRVGHAQDELAKTGCTVILPEKPVIAGVDVRGAAPGTRETELLAPHRTVQEIHAILLTGGSAFGLDAAAGVVAYLEELGMGYDTGVARVPIVPAAVIFDLAVGSSRVRPDRTMGYAAAKNAHRQNAAMGLTGAGIGATVGKFAGMDHSMSGGIGTCAENLEDGIVVGALVVVNALGNIIDPATGNAVAGARSPRGHFLDPIQYFKQPQSISFSHLTNTTLAVVATNVRFTKSEMTELAQLAVAGITRATLPAHTPYDGDVVFAISTGDHATVDLIRIGAVAADLVARAMIAAVQVSNSL